MARHTPRVFCSRTLATGALVEMDEATTHHLGTVLRLGRGDPLILFDGSGGEYEASVDGTNGNRLQVAVGAHQPVRRESPLDLTLAQGICRGARMDYCIQKSVELGVSRIQPLSAKRSMVKLRGDRADKKLSHWRGVARSAAEQSGREILPEVAPPQDSMTWLAQTRASGIRLLLDHRASHGLDELPKANVATLLVGPEGGLAPEEKALAAENDCIPVRMGPRIMRTETAGVAALAVIQALWGDLKGG